MPETSISAVAEKIAIFYNNSGDFNGLPLTSVVQMVENATLARDIVQGMVLSGQVNCAFYSLSGNPHIKRLPDPPIDIQISLLKEEEYNICICPTKQIIDRYLDANQYEAQPFTKEIFFGAAQIDWVSFDLSVLERYKYRGRAGHC
jgi:hypothetical protein